MTSNKSIYIIVPFYNESGLLKNIFENKILDQYQLILVDDGSNKPADLSSVSKPFYLLTHDKNLGQGAALQTGMEFANSLQADIVIHFDADGQHRAEEIEQLIQPIEKGSASMVLGSRFLKNNDAPNATQVLPLRRFILQVARLFQFYFTGIWLSDSQNGFRAIAGNALPLIEIRQNRMAHAIEIINIAKEKHLKMVEVPVTISYNKLKGTEGQKLTNAFFIVLRLLMAQLIKNKIAFSVLISLVITFCFKYAVIKDKQYYTMMLMATALFLMSNLIIWMLERKLKQLYIKTVSVRSKALATVKKINQ